MNPNYFDPSLDPLTEQATSVIRDVMLAKLFIDLIELHSYCACMFHYFMRKEMTVRCVMTIVMLYFRW